eukprot:535234-Amphidinium_carterae.1
MQRLGHQNMFAWLPFRNHCHANDDNRITVPRQRSLRLTQLGPPHEQPSTRTGKAATHVCLCLLSVQLSSQAIAPCEPPPPPPGSSNALKTHISLSRLTVCISVSEEALQSTCPFPFKFKILLIRISTQVEVTKEDRKVHGDCH